jgi:hypothetical protein
MASSLLSFGIIFSLSRSILLSANLASLRLVSQISSNVLTKKRRNKNLSLTNFCTTQQLLWNLDRPKFGQQQQAVSTNVGDDQTLHPVQSQSYSRLAHGRDM